MEFAPAMTRVRMTKSLFQLLVCRQDCLNRDHQVCMRSGRIARSPIVSTKDTWLPLYLRLSENRGWRTLKSGTTVSAPLPANVAETVLKRAGVFPFWTGKSARATCTSVWQEAYSRLATQTGIEVTSHRWRHTFAKNLLVAGVRLQTVSTLLGHRKLAITERYYARFVPERQASIDAEVRKTWALGGHSK